MINGFGSPGMMVETVVQASSLRGQDARPTVILHFLILKIPGEPGFEPSDHARHQMQARNIQENWLEATLTAPDQRLLLADSQGNTHYLKCIQDFGDRWLRVVVNPNVHPNRIITIFFERVK